MDKLTTSLVNDRLVSKAKVDEARQRQGMFGGQVGCILLEMGVLTEDQLLAALAKVSGFEPISTDRYAHLDRNAVELVDVDTVVTLHALPIRLHPDLTMDVLVTFEVDAEGLETLETLTGYKALPLIAPEFHFVQALADMLGRAMPQRYLRIVKSRHLTFAYGDRSGLERAVRLNSSRELAGHGTATVDRSLGLGWSSDEVVTFLAACTSRNTALELLLGYVGNFAQRRVMLVSSRSGLQGYSCAGFAGSPDPRRVHLPIEPDGTIAAVCVGDTFYQGPPENADLHIVYQALGVTIPNHCLLVPVPVGRRAALLIVIDDGSLKVAVDKLAPLFVAIRQLTKTLENIIKLSKSGQLPPAADQVPPVPERFRLHDKVLVRKPARAAGPVPTPQAPEPQRRAPRHTVPGPGLMRVAKSSSSNAQVTVADVDNGEAFDDALAEGWNLPSSFDLSTSAMGGKTSTSMRAKTEGVESTGDVESGEDVESDEDVETDEDVEDAEDAEDVGSNEEVDPVVTTDAEGRSLDPVTIEGAWIAPGSRARVKTRASKTEEAKSEDSVDKASLEPTTLVELEAYDPQSSEEPEASREPDGTGPEQGIEATRSSEGSPEPVEKSGELADPYQETVRILCGPSRQDSVEAAKILIESHGLAIPALLNAFPGPLTIDRYSYPSHRMPPVEEHGPVLRVLVDFGNLAAPALIGFLEDRSNEVRFYATYIFTRVRYEPALNRLAERLFDKDPLVREVAKVAAKTYKHMRSHDDLLATLRLELSSTDVTRSEQSAAALAYFCDLDAIDALIGVLDSGAARAVDAARRALMTICLQNFGLDAQAWSRWHARVAVDRNQWLVDALDHDNIEVRHLANNEIKTVPGLVLNYAPDAPVEQRRRAQSMLATFFSTGHAAS